jgi:hypothetical protein
MSREEEFLAAVRPMVISAARRRAQSLYTFDVAQELNLALLKMYRRKQDKPLNELRKIASQVIKKRLLDMFRSQAGRWNAKPKVNLDPFIDQKAVSPAGDPVGRAAIREMIEDIQANGTTAEVAVLDAYMDPPEDLVVASRAKCTKVLISLGDIAKFYGIGLRDVTKAHHMICGRLKSLVQTEG